MEDLIARYEHHRSRIVAESWRDLDDILARSQQDLLRSWQDLGKM